MLPTTQPDCPPELVQLIGAIEHYATSKETSHLEEQAILSLSSKVDPHLVQQYLREATGFAVLAAAQFQARKLDDQTKTFDRQIQRYDRLRYLVDIQIEQRGTTISPLASVKAILSRIEDPDYPSPVLNKSTAALCIGAIYSDYRNHDLIDALTANTAPDTARTIPLKELATLTCINKEGQYRYALEPSEDRAAELSDILEDLCVSLHDLRLYETVLNPARHTIEHNPNLSRAQESRTESDAKSMATQVAPLETNEKTQKPGRRSSKTKEQEPEKAVSQEPAAPSTIQGTDAQQELDTLENQAEAPQIGSYLREKGGYDALSPEQKAACDKDFQTHLDRRTRPIEVRDGETREDAVLRAKHEYCDARQEHTAHHRQLAKTMLASKMNCLNDKYPRDSFSLLNPDVAKEFMATAFYHHSATSRGLKSFDKDLFGTCKRAALKEFSVLAAGVETGAAGAKEFNDTFAINIERPPIGALNQNLRIAVKPLPGKREELAAIFGKCAWYHSNQSGRTPEEKEQRRAARTNTTQELGR